MQPKSPPVPRSLAILATLAALAALAGPARGGSGRYDKETRSFSMTYIYLDLPSGLLNEAQALSAGRPSRPDDEQAKNVQIFWQRTSALLSRVTAGRAKIGKLEETRDIAKADAVISLTGSVKPRAGGAWASVKGWNTPSATLNLYYNDLVNTGAEDVTQTVVHELLHYFMGLPDEYPSGGTGALCPQDAPGGLRCLMDNYHLGWNGRLCTARDHNPSAPGANGFPPVNSARLSCQEVVDSFFKALNVEVDPNAVIPAGGGDLASLPGVRESVLGTARAEVNRIKTRRGGRAGLFSADDRARVKGFLLKAIVDFAKAAGGAKPTGIGGFAEKLTSELLLSSLGVPPGLSLIEPFLRAQAARLGREAGDAKGKTTSIAGELARLARERLRGTPGVGASPNLSPEDIRYLGELAKQVASGKDVTGPETPAMLQQQLQAEMYQTVNDIANHLGLPGAVVRGDKLNEILNGLIPDRKLGDRFGRRTTVVIEPPVLYGRLAKEGLDRAETQGYAASDPKSNYNDLRRASLFGFTRLIDRNRVNVLTATSYQGDRRDRTRNKIRQGVVQAGSTSFTDDDAESIFLYDKVRGDEAGIDQALMDGVLADRKARIRSSLALIKDGIERNQIENIVLLVPPGGLPDDFTEALLPLRKQFLDKTDLRLDIALVGSAWIPDALRDIVTRTRGSILTVTDIDEVGAVAQRLAGQQTQGTWVTIPQQDYLLVDIKEPIFDRSDGEKTKSNKASDIEQDSTLFKRLRGTRQPHLVESKTGKDCRVVLNPFYVDPATSYQLIVGLTQPLTIAGLSDVPKPLGAPAAGDEPADIRKIPRMKSNQDHFPLPSMQLVSGQVRDPEMLRRMEGGVGAVMIGALTPDFRLNLEQSTPMILVFDLPADTSPGWYNPVLTLRGGNFHDAVAVDLAVDSKAKRAEATRLREAADQSTLTVTTKAQDVTKATESVKTATDATKAEFEAKLNAAKTSLDGAQVARAEADRKAKEAGDAATSAEPAIPMEFRPSDKPHEYRNGAIHFTFSVGTQTSKAQMVAGLLQDPPSDIHSTDQGTVTGNRAYLTAVLTAGAAVLDADVVGYVQRIDEGTEDIGIGAVNFLDNGTFPDKQKDDGVYTASFSLGVRREKRAEYRVFVEGRSIRDKTRFVPAGEPVLDATLAARRGETSGVLFDPAKPADDRKAPAFQRATSINFSVPGTGR